MYTLTANTPEAMRDEIVKWLKGMASNHRISSSRAVRVAIRVEETCRANSYQDAANFIERCEIVTKS